MNTSNQLKIVGQQGVQHKSIITEKKFELNSMKWKYENNFNLTIKTDEMLSNLKIKNHLCEMQSNKITKVIEIVYHNKVYQIQDIYHLHLDPQQLNHHSHKISKDSKDSTNTNSSDKNDNKNQSNEKKVYIFKNINRKGSEKDKKEKDSRNTKNIAKNFCKAFMLYLHSQKVSNFSRKQIKQAIKMYNNLCEQKKYNNTLIKTIIYNKNIGNLFKVFLNQDARQWINFSRVSDKALHLDAIEIFLKLYDKQASERGEGERESSQPMMYGQSQESSQSEQQ